MNKAVAFDLETYSTKANALVLSFGATVFEFGKLRDFTEYRDNGFHVKLDPSAQERRHVSLDTVDWWNTDTSQEAQERVLGDNPVGLSPKYFGQALNAWAGLQGLDDDTRWYCRGPNFDSAIIEDFAGDYGITLPFGWWQARDVRTFMDHFRTGEKLKKHPEFIEHYALDDAAWDAYEMCWWYQQR